MSESNILKELEKIELLIGKARGIEVLIRIIGEINVGVEILQNLPFEKLSTFEPKRMQEKLSKVISKYKNKKDIDKINNICSKIVHGQFFNAMNLIDKFIVDSQMEFGKPTKDQVGILYMENILDDENGKIFDIPYIIKSAHSNMILEEYDVFEKGGYYVITEKIIDYCKSLIFSENKNLDIKYISILSLKAMRTGNKVYR